MVVINWLPVINWLINDLFYHFDVSVSMATLCPPVMDLVCRWWSHAACYHACRCTNSGGHRGWIAASVLSVVSWSDRGLLYNMTEMIAAAWQDRGDHAQELTQADLAGGVDKFLSVGMKWPNGALFHLSCFHCWRRLQGMLGDKCWAIEDWPRTITVVVFL